MTIYIFDGTLTGLLCCVFRAFQFKEFEIEIYHQAQSQNSLLGDTIVVPSDDVQAQRVWQGLKQKISISALRNFYYTFLSENAEAFQHLFNFSVYVFSSQKNIDQNYGHPSVLALSKWAKQVGREKHRMEAFVRFKKCKDALFLSLIKPDFNVLPLIERHFKARYQDQKWLIYDEQRKYGIYYDLNEIHQIQMNACEIDSNNMIGSSQNFTIELDDEEVLYDKLWKDYFNSVNIQARQNMKLHIQYVPKRYWRYLNEKIL